MLSIVSTLLVGYLSVSFLLFIVYSYFESKDQFPLFTFYIHPKLKEEHKQILRNLNRDYDAQKAQIICLWLPYLLLFAFFGLAMR
ncbi:hypothetical protein ELBI_45 [Anabaena phage Elbi]|nr:hypothetical protein ELBI_45 [Anabaena phage Elbi]